MGATRWGGGGSGNGKAAFYLLWLEKEPTMQNINNGGFRTQFVAPSMFQYTYPQLWDNL
jgi:hypothetical protein